MSVRRGTLVAAILGFALGLTLSTLMSGSQMSSYQKSVVSSLQQQLFLLQPKPPASRHHLQLEGGAGPDKQAVLQDGEQVHPGEEEVALQLARDVKVLCWVMTNPDNHKTKALHVKATWGRRCNTLLFMSSEDSAELPSVGLNVTSEGRNSLWGKTRQAFEYAFLHHGHEADWFLKADDDTYTVVENLRFFLQYENASSPVYFGHKFSPYVKQGYFSGGGGYVLSKEALRRFVEKGLDDATLCRPGEEGAEDVEMGKCMENLGVVAGDSRDQQGHKRFFPFIPEHHLMGLYPDWYVTNSWYPEDKGFGLLSDYAISFHYIPPNMMYILDYFIYHLRPYGVSRKDHPKDDPIVKS